MASPQKENGFTSIAHEIMEALMMADLTKREFRLIQCILRYGYGFKVPKSTVNMSLVLLAKATRIYKQDIRKVISSLQKKSVIHVDEKAKTISLNKDYEVWKLLTPVPSKVSKLLMDGLVKYELIPKNGKQTTDHKVSKLLTWAGDNQSDISELELPKDILKDSIYKDILKDSSSLFKQLILALTQTRKSKTLSDSIIFDEIRYWSGFPSHIVLEAIKVYVYDKHYLEGKNEKYLRGIIRGFSNKSSFKPEPIKKPKIGEDKYAAYYIR